jgi:hypothetical protein
LTKINLIKNLGSIYSLLEQQSKNMLTGGYLFAFIVWDSAYKLTGKGFLEGLYCTAYKETWFFYRRNILF